MALPPTLVLTVVLRARRQDDLRLVVVRPDHVLRFPVEVFRAECTDRPAKRRGSGSKCILRKTSLLNFGLIDSPVLRLVVLVQRVVLLRALSGTYSVKVPSDRKRARKVQNSTL
jgi:hypothetical protein